MNVKDLPQLKLLIMFHLIREVNFIYVLVDSTSEFMMDHTLNVLTSYNFAGKKSDLNKSDSADKSKKADSESQKTKADQRGARQARWSPRNADAVGR